MDDALLREEYLHLVFSLYPKWKGEAEQRCDLQCFWPRIQKDAGAMVPSLMSNLRKLQAGGKVDMDSGIDLDSEPHWLMWLEHLNALEAAARLHTSAARLAKRARMSGGPPPAASSTPKQEADVAAGGSESSADEADSSSSQSSDSPAPPATQEEQEAVCRVIARSRLAQAHDRLESVCLRLTEELVAGSRLQQPREVLQQEPMLEQPASPRHGASMQAGSTGCGASVQAGSSSRGASVQTGSPGLSVCKVEPGSPPSIFEDRQASPLQDSLQGASQTSLLAVACRFGAGPEGSIDMHAFLDILRRPGMWRGTAPPPRPFLLMLWALRSHGWTARALARLLALLQSPGRLSGAVCCEPLASEAERAALLDAAMHGAWSELPRGPGSVAQASETETEGEASLTPDILQSPGEAMDVDPPQTQTAESGGEPMYVQREAEPECGPGTFASQAASAEAETAAVAADEAPAVSATDAERDACLLSASRALLQTAWAVLDKVLEGAARDEPLRRTFRHFLQPPRPAWGGLPPLPPPFTAFDHTEERGGEVRAAVDPARAHPLAELAGWRDEALTVQWRWQYQRYKDLLRKRARTAHEPRLRVVAHLLHDSARASMRRALAAMPRLPGTPPADLLLLADAVTTFKAPTRATWLRRYAVRAAAAIQRAGGEAAAGEEERLTWRLAQLPPDVAAVFEAGRAAGLRLAVLQRALARYQAAHPPG
uniref:Uncharacterized protein n=1 Tax=Auxenochlorella protothecoides TaxID=3075 RepID=A0A1D1ZUG4_AUXPR